MRGKTQPLLDKLLSLLRDGQWHSMDQMALELGMSAEELLLALRFLSEYSFVEFEEERCRVRITAHTKK